MNPNDRSITALVTVAHGAVHTYEMTIPIFVVIWLREFEIIDLGLIELSVTTASLGVVVTLGYGLFGLGALPGGVLVDRIGSRSLISLSLLGMGGAYLLLGLAPGMAVVALALVLWGVAASVYHPAGLSLISKGVEERGTGFAYHGIAGNVGIGLGPLLALVFLLFFEWRTVALLMGVPAVAAAVYARRARFDERAAVSDDADAETDAGGVGSLSEFLGESRRLFGGLFAVVFVVVMASGLYYRGVLTFLPELLRDVGQFESVPLATLLPESLRSAAGVDAGGEQVLNPQDYFYSGLLLVGVVGQYVGGKLTDRVRVEYGFAVAFGVLALLALAFVPASRAGTVPLVVLGAVLGVFLFLVQPMYQATVAEYTPPGTRGLSYGFTYLGVFGVGALGGGVAGTILAFGTPTLLFSTLAAFATTAALLGLFLGKRRARGDEETGTRREP